MVNLRIGCKQGQQSYKTWELYFTSCKEACSTPSKLYIWTAAVVPWRLGSLLCSSPAYEDACECRHVQRIPVKTLPSAAQKAGHKWRFVHRQAGHASLRNCAPKAELADRVIMQCFMQLRNQDAWKLLRFGEDALGWMQSVGRGCFSRVIRAFYDCNADWHGKGHAYSNATL
eukprot:986537-Pelagomonas_calceolata.AAC.4